MTVSLPKLISIESSESPTFTSEMRDANPGLYEFTWFEGVIPKNYHAPEESDLGSAGGKYARGLFSALYDIRANIDQGLEYAAQRGFQFYNMDPRYPDKAYTLSTKEIAEYLRIADTETLTGYYTWDPSTIIGIKGKKATGEGIQTNKQDIDYAQIFSKTSLPQFMSTDQKALAAFYNNNDDLIELLSRDQRISDENFARSFIAGALPDQLKKVSSDETGLDDILALDISKYNIDGSNPFNGDSIKQALKDGRLFQVDYNFMKDMKPGTYKSKTYNAGNPFNKPHGPSLKKYVYGATGYFIVPKSDTESNPIWCVAIQVKDNSVNNVLVQPKDAWSWLIAKGMLNASHYTYHEGVGHLGFTHLVNESVVTAMRRTMPIKHPIYHLLNKHFEGTRNINHLAFDSLIQPDASVDRLVGAQINDDASGHKDTVWGLIAERRANFNFKDNYLENKISQNGLEGIPEYPYRDDGRKIWSAIKKWVTQYVEHYYDDSKTDGSSSKYPVAYDQELQTWAALVSSTEPNVGGGLKGFGTDGKITSTSELIDICTMIIFTASAQHAAVNFTQKTDMIYLPAAPLSGFLSLEDFTKKSVGSHTKEDYLRFLPPLDVAFVQCSMLEMLGSVFHTQLGYYDDNIGSRVKPYFTDEAIRAYNSDFQDEINDRNESKFRSRHPYLAMLPSRLPQSINI